LKVAGAITLGVEPSDAGNAPRIALEIVFDDPIYSESDDAFPLRGNAPPFLWGIVTAGRRSAA
jgi:hypothetical protein